MIVFILWSYIALCQGNTANIQYTKVINHMQRGIVLNIKMHAHIHTVRLQELENDLHDLALSVW